MHATWSQVIVSAGARWRALRESVSLHWVTGHRWSVAAAIGLLVVAGAFVWAGTCGFEGCPTAAELQAFRPTEGGRVLDRNGQLLGRLVAVRRINVPLSRIPRQVRAAFIAVEDRRFLEHDGIDWRGALRAAWRNLTHLEVREGSSTLTMQAARTAFLADYDGERSLRRKLIELVLARRIEHALTKQQILELYLNVIYLGESTYGVEAASRHFFGKGVRELSLGEAAALAALPRAPSVYDPRRHPDRALARRNLVLALMVKQGSISQAQADEAAAEPIVVAPDGWEPVVATSTPVEMARAFADSVLGADVVRGRDLVVRTTFDAKAQRAAEEAVRARAGEIDGEGGGWDEYGNPAPTNVEGAMVALDPRTGELRAIVGGREMARGGYNRAVASRRQPGSAFKPFVYAAAMEAGLTPATLVDDWPVDVPQPGTGDEHIWRPANYGDEYGGRMTLRRALARSSNAAAVRVSQNVGVPKVVDVARRMGVASPIKPYPSVALGAVDVTPFELVTAYAPLANGGLRVTPTFVRVIEVGGRVKWRGRPAKTTRALDERDAFLVTSMLRSVVDEGSGRAVRAMGVRGPVAGKTGTTNNGADVWFVGYTPTLVAGFWFGYDTPRRIGYDASGGRLAAPAWARFYARGWREPPGNKGWVAPAGVVSKNIDEETGMLAGEWCPTTRREWFRRGTEPTQVCDAHGQSIEGFVADIGARLGRALRGLLVEEAPPSHEEVAMDTDAVLAMPEPAPEEAQPEEPPAPEPPASE